MDIKWHAIKHLKEIVMIDLCYCPSKLMIADILTNSAAKPDFQRNRTNLKLQDHPNSDSTGIFEYIINK